jgi:biotin operon repressor
MYLNQHEQIREYMLEKTSEGKWVSLEDIELALCYSQSSISAQIRHLRKPKFGSYIVNKRHKGDGWEYQVIPQEGIESWILQRQLKKTD